MRRYEAWAIVLIIAYIVTVAATPLHSLVIAQLLTAREVGEMSVRAQGAVVTRALFGLVINVVVAVWIFRVAKRDNASPWVWAMFGFVFSVLAPCSTSACRSTNACATPTAATPAAATCRNTSASTKQTAPIAAH